jgi:hypothetical protein
MGTGSGPGGINSRIYTISYAGKSNAASFPFRNKGTSFGGLTKPQYSYSIYYSLANNGAGAGNRAGRWAVAHGQQIAFNPPSPITWRR